MDYFLGQYLIYFSKNCMSMHSFIYVQFVFNKFKLISAACDRPSAVTGFQEDICLYFSWFCFSGSNTAFLVMP